MIIEGVIAAYHVGIERVIEGVIAAHHVGIERVIDGVIVAHHVGTERVIEAHHVGSERTKATITIVIIPIVGCLGKFDGWIKLVLISICK